MGSRLVTRAASSCCCRPAVFSLSLSLSLSLYAAMLSCCYVCVCARVGVWFSLAGGIVAFSAPTRRDVCLLPGLVVGPLR